MTSDLYLDLLMPKFGEFMKRENYRNQKEIFYVYKNIPFL